MENFDLRQKKALRNIKWTVNNECGMLENSVADHSYGYKDDEALLNNHEALMEHIYECVVTEFHEEGHTIYGRRAEQLIGDIKFCGKEWLMEQIDKQLKKEGY